MMKFQVKAHCFCVFVSEKFHIYMVKVENLKTVYCSFPIGPLEGADFLVVTL